MHNANINAHKYIHQGAVFSRKSTIFLVFFFTPTVLGTIKAETVQKSTANVESQNNPADCSNHPKLVTADSVKPGSVCLNGHSWMSDALEKVRQDGVIKQVKRQKIIGAPFKESQQICFEIKNVQQIRTPFITMSVHKIDTSLKK